MSLSRTHIFHPQSLLLDQETKSKSVKMASKLEYLQRYMTKGSETTEKKLKKKRKKDKTSGSSSLRIVDGDHDWELEAPKRRDANEQWEMDAAEDEAPVVVANGEMDPEDMPTIANAEEYQEELHREAAQKTAGDRDAVAKDSDGDASPPRRGRTGDASPPRRRQQSKSDDDASPPRRRGRATSRDEAGDVSPPRRRPKATETNDDASPPRRRAKASETNDDASPPRRRAARARDSDDDVSPPRRTDRKTEKKDVSDDDMSPPRRRQDSKPRERSPVRPSSGRDTGRGKRLSRSRSRGRGDRDRRGGSPPRRERGRRSPSRSRGRSRRSDRRRSRSASVDRSRDRRRRSPSPRRDSRSNRRSRSPADRKPRRDDRRSDRRKSRSRSRSRSASPPRSSARKRSIDEDASPPRKSHRKASDDEPVAVTKAAPVEAAALPPADEYKPRAGLFTATEFAEDLKKKTAHNDILRGAKAEDMGQNAETVYRDKKGRKLDMLNEMARQQEIMEGKVKRQAVEEYEWGTGRVQKEERLNQKELLDKMKSKPFARRNDDEELEQMRRERVRAFDPMNSKVFQDDSLFDDVSGKKKSKKSKSKKSKAKTSSGKPKYAGPPAPPNRFGVQPGYRWDGVVRGTGWEEKLMLRENTQNALSDEAYRYAVADM